MSPPLGPLLERLASGAAAWARRAPRERADLARRTALAVADVGAEWVDAALAIKGVPPRGDAWSGPARCEEVATGPVVTLRLLFATARAWEEIDRSGRPRPARPPRLVHPGSGEVGPLVAVELLPEPRLFDHVIHPGHRAEVRCVAPGGVAGFDRAWEREVATRPAGGGVTAVLGAGNVTGLSPADAIAQIFEHGRAAMLKLHPLHAPLEPVYRRGLAPLVDAGLLEIVCGGAELARELIAAPAVTHVHLTGSRAAFDAIVRGDGTGPLAKPITGELGGVTPWIVVPGRYRRAQLRFQADLVAASIAGNTSFNCIATKCLVTCRDWPQRGEFLDRIAARLAALPPRPAWYPGAAAAWAEATGRVPPADGTLPWMLATGVDAARDRRLLDREWFVPVAAEVPLEAADLDAFCGRAAEFARTLPGSLAASVTIPAGLPAADARRAELLVEHLRAGAVAVNTWSAVAYALASLPWGGYPGGTLSEPGSGLGRVHDPLMLPLVHDVIVRAPLATRFTVAWAPWHRGGAELAIGLLDIYAAIAGGRGGWWRLLRLLPTAVRG